MLTPPESTILWSLGWQHLGVIGCLLSQGPNADYTGFVAALNKKGDNWIKSAFKGDKPSEFVSLIRDHSQEWQDNDITWDWSLFNSGTIKIRVVSGIGSDIRHMALSADTLYLPSSLFPPEMHDLAVNASLPTKHVRIYATFDAADSLVECDEVCTAPGDPAAYRNKVNAKSIALGFGTNLGEFDIEATLYWLGTSRVEKVMDSMSIQPKLRVVVGQSEVKNAPWAPGDNKMPAWPCGAFAGESRSTLGGCL